MNEKKKLNHFEKEQCIKKIYERIFFEDIVSKEELN